MATTDIDIAGPAGRLQASVEVPEQDAGAAMAVICHPHPLRGGTMDNKVVTTLARSCHQLQVPTVRFNFRGVGTSEGSFDEGQGEQDDALAVCAWARRNWPQRPLWLLGFSFGAVVAARVAQRTPTARLVTIAPPARRMALSWDAPEPPPPWLLVHGDADDVVPYAEITSWLDTLEHSPRLVVFADAGHFFHGRLTELRDTVVEFLQERHA